mmetsp:Transcript_1073/g.2917  ORF Transcript_1073/g.2917 Transcript_1073/m.2917 type:complete len:337 (-) Transcript_1073:1299-2309(-)
MSIFDSCSLLSSLVTHFPPTQRHPFLFLMFDCWRSASFASRLALQVSSLRARSSGVSSLCSPCRAASRRAWTCTLGRRLGAALRKSAQPPASPRGRLAEAWAVAPAKAWRTSAPCPREGGAEAHSADLDRPCTQRSLQSDRFRGPSSESARPLLVQTLYRSPHRLDITLPAASPTTIPYTRAPRSSLAVRSDAVTLAVGCGTSPSVTSSTSAFLQRSPSSLSQLARRTSSSDVPPWKAYCRNSRRPSRPPGDRSRSNCWSSSPAEKANRQHRRELLWAFRMHSKTMAFAKISGAPPMRHMLPLVSRHRIIGPFPSAGRASSERNSWVGVSSQLARL